MVGTKGSQAVRWSQSQKAGPSSDWSLQLDSMKVESPGVGDRGGAWSMFRVLVRTLRHVSTVGGSGSGVANPSGR